MTKKGDLVAFSIVETTVVLGGAGTPSRVERDETWHIGRVRASTRDGRVREVEDWTEQRWKMLNKAYRVGFLCPIPPRDVAEQDALYAAAGGQSFPTLEACRSFALRWKSES